MTVFERKIARLVASYEMVGWKVLERLYLRKPRPLEFRIRKAKNWNERIT